MSVDYKACLHTDPRDRRNFLGASFALTAAAAVGMGALSEVAYADALTKAQKELVRLFRSAGIDSIQLRTDQPYAGNLGRFFETREKRRRHG